MRITRDYRRATRLGIACWCLVLVPGSLAVDAPAADSAAPGTAGSRPFDEKALRTLLRARGVAEFETGIRLYDLEHADDRVGEAAVVVWKLAGGLTLARMKADAYAYAICPRPEKNSYQQPDVPGTPATTPDEDRELARRQDQWERRMQELQSQTQETFMKTVAFEARAERLVDALGPAAAVGLVVHGEQRRVEALGEKGAERLRATAAKEGSEYRWAAYFALRELFPEVAPPQIATQRLLAIVADRANPFRNQACQALAERTSEAAKIGPALLAMSGDQAFSVRVADTLLELSDANLDAPVDYMDKAVKGRVWSPAEVVRSLEETLAQVEKEGGDNPSWSNVLRRADLYRRLAEEGKDPLENCKQALDNTDLALQLIPRNLSQPRDKYDRQLAFANTRRERAQELTLLGRLLKKAGQAAEAENMLGQAEELFAQCLAATIQPAPERIFEQERKNCRLFALTYRARLFRDREQPEKALGDYDAAASLDPENRAAEEAKGDTLLQMSRYADADKTYATAAAREHAYLMRNMQRNNDIDRSGWACMARIYWKQSVACRKLGDSARLRVIRSNMEGALKTAAR